MYVQHIAIQDWAGITYRNTQTIMLKSTRLVISLHFHDCRLVSLPLNLCFSGLLGDGYVMREGRRKRKSGFTS